MRLKCKSHFLIIIWMLFLWVSPVSAQGSYPLDLTEAEKAWIKSHPGIRVGIMSQWPPLNFVDSYGRPKGVGTDYLKAMNKRLGNILTPVPGSFDQNMEGVKEKTLDALMDITPKKEREPFFEFTNPYLTIPHVMVGRKDGPYYRTELDLGGKTLALEKGFYNVRYFTDQYPQVRIREYPNTSQALGAVIQGEADAYAGNRAVALFIIENELMTTLQIQGTLNKPPVVLAMGVRKDWPELAAILNKALLSISVAEERQIRQIWVGASVSPGPVLPQPLSFDSTGFVLKGVLVLFGVISALLLLIWMAKGCPRHLSLNGILMGVSLVFIGLIAGICLLVLLLLQMEKQLADIDLRRDKSIRLAYELKQSSDDQTRFARTFASTGEFRFETYYRDVIAIRSGIKPHPRHLVPSYWDHVAADNMNLDDKGEMYSIAEKMDELGITGKEREKLAQAKKDSDELMQMETIAINAVKGLYQDGQGNFARLGEPDRTMAIRLLNSAAYHQAKSKIMTALDDFFALLEWRTRSEMDFQQQKTKAVLTVISLLTVLTVLFAVFSFFLLKRRIIQPLYQLKSGANILKEGDYAHHMDIRTQDEVGDLALTFNAMADSIRDRTQRLRSIIETAIDAIVVVSSRGEIQEFSPAAEAMFGYPAADIIGRPVSLIIPGAEQEGGMASFLAQDGQDKIGKRFETSGKRKGGQVFSVSVSVSGSPMGGERQFTGIIRDITERRSIERARQASLKMNQMTDTAKESELLEFALEECVRLTGSRFGYLHFVDSETLSLQTWSRETLATCSVPGNVSHLPIDQAGVWAECIRTKSPVIHNTYDDLPMRKGFPTGHIPLTRDLAVPVEESGRIVAIMGVGSKEAPYAPYDAHIVSMLSTNLWGIVRRIRAARLLRENEKRLNLVLKGGNLGYWDVNLKTRETIINERWAQMLGYDLKEAAVPYEIWKSTLHPEDFEQVLQAGRDYLAGQDQTYEVEYRAVKKNGEVRWLISRGAVVERDASGQPLRMVGTVLDITEKKIIEEELRQNMEDLRRFSNIAVGREEKMIHLKEEVNTLLAQAGKTPRYTIVN